VSTTNPHTSDAADPLTPTDHKAFAFAGQVNSSLRACLCTLARHGVALRRRCPERAAAALALVRPWPLYKGGQFLFDLMEWEDLMVDGEPPPLMPAERIRGTFSYPVRWLATSTAPHPTPVGPLPGQRTAATLDLPLRLLAGTARAALEGAALDLGDLLGAPAAAPPETEADSAVEDDELPHLEAGFYLYQDIVLGALTVLGPLLAEHAPEEQRLAEPGDG